jgi:hypothetical protein
VGPRQLLVTHPPSDAGEAGGDEPEDPSDPNLGCQTTGCLAGAAMITFFSGLGVVLGSGGPHGAPLLAGFPLAAVSVLAWGGALLLRARATGSRAARTAAYVLLAVGTVLMAALAWIVVELFRGMPG